MGCHIAVSVNPRPLHHVIPMASFQMIHHGDVSTVQNDQLAWRLLERFWFLLGHLEGVE
jgi:hypothetical protein